MTALALYAPSDCRRSKKRLAAYEQKHDALSRYMATDAGKIEAGMYAIGMACERAVRIDPEYRECIELEMEDPDQFRRMVEAR